jgi:UDP-N-acetylglucosamine 2-epimerase (non-hydrolysing)
LDRLCEHVVVHTGQNYDPKLKDIFFKELGVRAPDRCLDAAGSSLGQSLGRIFERGAAALRELKPDRVLILGDTNSSLLAIVAKRMGIPVFHMEAGNRCYDDRVPEEVNRRVIDHSSDILMPYTERSRMNLLREGIAGEHIFVTGNPIHEVIRHYEPQIKRSTALRHLRLRPGKYFLVTAHREENVDVAERLRSIVQALDRTQKEYRLPIVVSTHPRTRKRIESSGVRLGNTQVRFLEPFGFFDFIALERSALCVLSDSGTVQEECCILHVPTVTLRDTTERPETVECGSNMLVGVQPENVLRGVRTVLQEGREWAPPPEYLAERVSETVVKIVLGHVHSADRDNL